MTQLQQKVTLPAAMAEKLDTLRQRTLKVRFGTAVVAAVGVLLAAMAVAMLVDWLATLYDTRWRAALTYSAWSIAGLTFAAWAVAAWRHTRQVANVAAELDREMPELEERWSTVTEISSNGHSTGVHPAMFKQVSSEAQKWTPHIEADRVVPLDGLVRSLLALTAITAILGFAVLFDSRRTTVLLQRFWQPHAPISATQLVDVTGETVVGRGESVEVAAYLTGLPVDEASLILEHPQGESTTISLAPHRENQDQLTHRLRSVKEPLRYRFRAGDGQSPWYEITVADRPQIANVRMTLTPPAYTRKEPKVLDKLPRRVMVLEGSQIEIAFKPKQSLRSLELKLSDDHIQQLTPDHEGWYRWQTTLSKSISFQPLLTEEHGLTNLRPPLCELRCRPDKPPVVKILSPNNEMAVRPDETIPITFVARDDVGIQQAELIVYDEHHRVDGKPTVLDRISVDLGDQQGAIHVKAAVDLDLSKYKASDGSELSFSIRVREDRGQDTLASSEMNKQPSQQPNRPATDSTATTSNTDQIATADEANATDSEPVSQEQPLAQSSPAPTMEQSETTKPTPPTPINRPVEDSLAEATNPSELNNPTQDLSAESTSVPQSQTARPADEQPSNTESLVQPPTAEQQPTSDQLPTNADPTTSESTSQPKAMPEDNTDSASTEPADDSSVTPSDKATPTTSDNDSGESRTTDTNRQTLNAQDAQATNDPTPNADVTPTESRVSDNKAAQDSPASQEQASTPKDAADQVGQENPNSVESNSDSNNAKTPPNSPSTQQQASSPNDNPNPSNTESSNQQNPSQSQPSTAQTQASTKNQPPPGSQFENAPPNPMSLLKLDVDQAQSSNSKRMKIKVDQWAGSYDGQQRQELEIAIAPRLAELDKALEKAETLSRAVLSDIDESEQWKSKHDRDIQRADEQIDISLKIVTDLEEKTYGSPYAFIGLQLVDISQAHIAPARRDFWKAMQLDSEVRIDATRNGWQHTTRARDLLKSLTERFQRTQAEYKLAESVERVKKMYRVYIEGSMALLQPDDTEGSRYGRKRVEFDLDEEYLARLKEVLDMRNEMRAELARILSEDPRLLRRFLDAQRNRELVLRNELDRLTEQQENLNRETRAWAAAEEDKRPELSAILLGRHIESAQELAFSAAELHDRFETWSPLGQEAQDTEFLATAEILQEIATVTQELSTNGTQYVTESLRARKKADSSEEEASPETDFDAAVATEQIAEDAQQLYDRFTQLEILLRQIGNRPDEPEIALFATNRLLETRRLVEQTSAWIRQLKQQQAGKYHRSAEVAQYRLAMQTDSLTGKLADLEQQLAVLFRRQDGMLPEALAEKARKLLAKLDEQVSPNQLAAVYALRRNRMSQATSRQETALGSLQLVGKLYDEMIEEAIKELDKMPVQDPIASLLDDPTLDELLSELEQEVPIQELLGIPRRPSNLQIMGSWLRPGGDNSLMTGGGGQMLMNQMRQQQQMRQRQLEKAYQRAVARALKETQAEDLVKDRPELARETTDWNQLASQLSDDLNQGRDKAPPERYRKAIEQYFRQVSGAENEAN